MVSRDGLMGFTVFVYCMICDIKFYLYVDVDVCNYLCGGGGGIYFSDKQRYTIFLTDYLK